MNALPQMSAVASAAVSATTMNIVHFTACWLPQTMTWLYTHMSFLPDNCESHVVCQWTQNLDQFPVKHITSLQEPPRPGGLVSKVQRRLGIGSPEKRNLKLLENVLQKVRPHVLHSHFGNCGWANSKIAQKLGVAHVVSFYGVDLSHLPRTDPRWYSRYREMSDRVNLALCEGPHMARCIADLGVDPGKIRIFRLGIDLDRIPFTPRQNNSAGTKRFLIAGSFREKKGMPYALEALALVRKSFPDMTITVVGDSSGNEREDQEKRKIMYVVRRCGLGPVTRFLGYQPYEHVIQQFYRHDIFVSPSVTAADGDTEGGAPVTVIEAAASGMPVASTRHCDIPFVLSEENGAYLAPERDSQALADVIERLCRREDWRPVVNANRRLVEEELDVRRQARKLGALYAELQAH